MDKPIENAGSAASSADERRPVLDNQVSIYHISLFTYLSIIIYLLIYLNLSPSVNFGFSMLMKGGMVLVLTYLFIYSPLLSLPSSLSVYPTLSIQSAP